MNLGWEQGATEHVNVEDQGSDDDCRRKNVANVDDENVTNEDR
jgi:hypothetical protein